MTKWFLAAALLLLFFACKRKKNEPQGQVFPVTEFLRKEVKSFDSLNPVFTRILTREDVRDTASIDKATAKQLAADFLQLEDISTEERKKAYDIANFHDSLTNSLQLTYTTKETDEPIQRETVVMEPDAQGSPRVTTVIVDYLVTRGDSTVEKNLVWYSGKRYQVLTKVYRDQKLARSQNLVVRWE